MLCTARKLDKLEELERIRKKMEEIYNITGWNFDNSYAHLPRLFFSVVKPTAVNNPMPVIINFELAKSLGIDREFLTSSEGIKVLSGNKIPEGALPIAQAYAGHQFGYFTILGDGRVILLGEQIPRLAIALIFNSRALVGHLIPAVAMVGRLLDLCCANTSSAKRCMRWVFLRHVVLR